MILDPLNAEDIEVLNQIREGVPITNAATSKSTKKVKISGKEEGITLVSTGDFYTSPKVDVETITNLRDDIYIAGVINKQKNLIFNEKYTIEVIDTKTRKIDEELSNTLMEMCETPSVRLWANMSWSYECLFSWGLAPFNPVWGIDKEAGTSDIRLLKLRQLPPETFKTAPSGQQYIYSPILFGIVPDPKTNELTFYQEPEPNKTPVQVNNVFYIKNPSDRGFAGNPIIVPCVNILGMLGFTWNASMEQVNRIGSKTLFMRVTNPSKPDVNKFRSIEYSNEIVKNWGKDLAYSIPDNFEPIDLKLTDDSNNLAVIDKLSDLISEYVNPASFIASRQETRLGGNDNAKLEMHDNYVKGWHSIFAEQFERLLNRYFEYNGFAPNQYQVRIRIPPPSHNTREDNRKDVEALFLAQSIDEREARRIFPHLNLKELDDKGLADLRAHFASIQRTPQIIKAS